MLYVNTWDKQEKNLELDWSKCTKLFIILFNNLSLFTDGKPSLDYKFWVGYYKRKFMNRSYNWYWLNVCVKMKKNKLIKIISNIFNFYIIIKYLKLEKL